ncbi:MAG: hypothetical protein ACFFE2_01910 [Candidatus Thorarchaeota archaeon]
MVKDKISEIIIRACRIPKKAAIRMGEISEEAYKKHIKPKLSSDHLPYKAFILIILFTTLLPSFLTFSYRFTPATSVTLESETNDSTYSEMLSYPQSGVNTTVLFNSTPFNPGREMDSFSYYDFNKNAWNASDGYHLEYDPFSEWSGVSFHHREYVPILNCSDVSIHVVIEGIEGKAGLYLEGFASDKSIWQEAEIDAGMVSETTLHLPIVQAKVVAKLGLGSWLCPLIFKVGLELEEGTHIVIRSVTIQAFFEIDLYPVIFDFQDGDGESLYQNPNMLNIRTNPQLYLTVDNDSETLSLFTPDDVNKTVYLPLGTYEGVAYWRFDYATPNPLNWSSNVFFEVQSGTALHVSIIMYTIRIDLEFTPKIMFKYLSVDFMEERIYNFEQFILDTTLENPLPTSLFIPGGTGTLRFEYFSWSPYAPQTGTTFNPPSSSKVETIITIDETNSSRNLMIHINHPYLSVLGVALGVGEILMLIMAIVLVCSSVFAFRGVYRYSNLRHRLNDTRLIPVTLLTISVFIPWMVKLNPYPDALYNGGGRVVWWVTPLMIRWYNGFSGQISVASNPWFSSFVYSVTFLLIPIIYGWFVISRPESDKLERGFVISLLLPYLAVLSALDYTSSTGCQPSIGLILVLLAFPIWLVRYLFKRVGLLS